MKTYENIYIHKKLASDISSESLFFPIIHKQKSDVSGGP